MSYVTTLDAISTSTPAIRGRQADAAAFMKNVERLPKGIRARLDAIYNRSGIEYRHTCVEDYVRDPDDFTFFGRNWSLEPEPTTGERNERYREAAVPLALEVGHDVLEAAGAAPEDITHVIAVSCTGLFAPGLDIALVKGLGLPPTTQRTMIGFMGCYAAFNALRVAHAYCQSTPSARVLVVCVELCTLHFQVKPSLENAIVNALFADGAAAAVLSARPKDEATGALSYVGNHTVMDDDSLDHMTWAIGDRGFDMGLSSRVPSVLARHLAEYVDALLKPHDLERGAVDFWAIHPGGRAIVEAAQRTLQLDDEDVADSLEVLRAYGNMSSATVLFVLQRFLHRHDALLEAGQKGIGSGIAMAFGPGLTLEGALFKEVKS